jgi:hypothetical protein
VNGHQERIRRPRYSGTYICASAQSRCVPACHEPPCKAPGARVSTVGWDRHIGLILGEDRPYMVSGSLLAGSVLMAAHLSCLASAAGQTGAGGAHQPELKCQEE